MVGGAAYVEEDVGGQGERDNGGAGVADVHGGVGVEDAGDDGHMDHHRPAAGAEVGERPMSGGTVRIPAEGAGEARGVGATHDHAEVGVAYGRHVEGEDCVGG